MNNCHHRHGKEAKRTPGSFEALRGGGLVTLLVHGDGRDARELLNRLKPVSRNLED